MSTALARLTALEAELAAVRADKRAAMERVADWFRWHGCLTGDCPHKKANDCLAALKANADEVDLDALATRESEK